MKRIGSYRSSEKEGEGEGEDGIEEGEGEDEEDCSLKDAKIMMMNREHEEVTSDLNDAKSV